MKKIIFIFTMAAFIVSCDNEKKEAAEAAATTATEVKPDVKYPFPVGYSKFEMGNPEYSAMVLQGSWKDWEDNKLNKTKWLADTVAAYHSDNSVTKGADSLIARWTRLRSQYSSSVSSISAVMSVVATEQKENWVLIWADEFDTNMNGKKDTTSLMEAWRINKDGKADMLLQYDRKPRKP
jgi:hypothetical protein